jgi:hypothetical protein
LSELSECSEVTTQLAFPPRLSGGYHADMADFEAELRMIGDILESIAAGFPPDSKEALAIRDAALAYSIIRMDKELWQRFQGLHFDRKITDEEIGELNAKLRSYGIDPDERVDGDDD